MANAYKGKDAVTPIPLKIKIFGQHIEGLIYC